MNSSDVMPSSDAAARGKVAEIEALNHTDDLFKQAGLLHQLGHLGLAQAIYQEILAIDPGHVNALHFLGLTYWKLNQIEKGLDLIEQAIRLAPSKPKLHFNKAVLLEAMGKIAEAIESYDCALARECNYVEAWVNRGSNLKKLGRFEEAIQSFEQAIAIDADCAAAYSNLGNTFAAMRRWEQTLSYYEKAIQIAPLVDTHHINKSNALRMLGRFEDARICFDLALQSKPDSANLKWNMAYLLLLTGRWERAWQLYESRWDYQDNAQYRRYFEQPLWTGEQPLSGKTILLHHEQGLGDTIQFCRYAKLVHRRGAKVILQVPRSLLQLMDGLSGIDAHIETDAPLPHFDFHCPLLSLPMAFQTTMATIPSDGPYLFADIEKANHWRQRIAVHQKLKVGLVWSGGVREGQRELNETRNIPLSIVASVLADLDITIFSLQKGEPEESAIKGRELAYWPRANFYNYADEIKDFADTAAIIENLDLVIAVDTSTLHLAAAMGKPTYLLNRYDTCWRWMLDVDNSPWYPTLKIFRQDATMDWQVVIKRVRIELEGLAKEYSIRAQGAQARTSDFSS